MNLKNINGIKIFRPSQSQEDYVYNYVRGKLFSEYPSGDYSETEKITEIINYHFSSYEGLLKRHIDLLASLKGSAELRFHHESDYIKFEAQSLGHIEVTGEFLEYGQIQQNIYFGFVFDQSYLPSFIESLKAVSASLYS